MKQHRTLLIAFAFLFPLLLASGFAHAEGKLACMQEAVDTTPVLSAFLESLDLSKMERMERLETAEGLKIETALFEAYDPESDTSFEGTMTCSSVCSGSGTCSASGCTPIGTNCSTFNCNGFDCRGSCKKTITIAIK